MLLTFTVFAWPWGRLVDCIRRRDANRVDVVGTALYYLAQIGSRIRTIVTRCVPVCPGSSEIMVSGRSNQASTVT